MNQLQEDLTNSLCRPRMEAMAGEEMADYLMANSKDPDAPNQSPPCITSLSDRHLAELLRKRRVEE